MSGEQTHRSPGTQYCIQLLLFLPENCTESSIQSPESRLYTSFTPFTFGCWPCIERMEGRTEVQFYQEGSWDEGSDKGRPHLLWPIREHTLNTTRRVASAKGDQCK